MATIPFQSHFDLIEHRQEQFKNLLHQGLYSPLLLLRHILATFSLVLIPLLIRSTSTFQSQLVRYTFHAVLTGVSIYNILHVRYFGPANGYTVGLITTWFYIWGSTILVFNDVQKDFKRIEKEYVQPSSPSSHILGEGKGNGSLRSYDTRNSSSKIHPSRSVVHRNKSKKKVYHWQPFPDSFSHRIDWVLDLTFNLRGPNWNWSGRSAPPPPEFVLNDIGSQGARRQSKALKPVVQDASTRLRLAFYYFVRDYIALDIIKVVMMRDPYFWGFVDECPPPPWPFTALSFSPILVRIYRLLISMSAVLFALDIITSLGPLFFLGLSLAFPNFSRSITHQPLDEAWLYPPAFGPASSVLDYGLIGAWNTWWHQLFRFGFAESGRFISHLIIPNTLLGQNRQKHPFLTLARRLLQVLIAFSMSGLIHAMGSYTALADSKPINSFLFFFLQGIAVLVQSLFLQAVPKSCRLRTTQSPMYKLLIRTFNFVTVFVWFYFTAPLVADDFAQSGMWTFEPLPISPVRGGLRWGLEGEGWICWKGAWTEQWHGDSWWWSGTRFL